jgi:hypothetical protein
MTEVALLVVGGRPRLTPVELLPLLLPAAGM